MVTWATAGRGHLGGPVGRPHRTLGHQKRGGSFRGEVLESPCSTGGGDCEEGGEGGEGGGGGGVTLGKRSLRKPGRNWFIRVQVTPHKFVKSTA